MKHHLTALFQQAFDNLKTAGILPADTQAKIQIERSRDTKFGDYACNLAMQLAKPAKQKPRDLAAHILTHLPESALVSKTEIAGPGFINIYMASEAYHALVKDILSQKDTFGQSPIGAQQKVHIEFVSANPTGPLHVGHGRGAAYGAALASLLRASNHDVYCEYYVNDAGRQMDILACSVWLRYLELCGEDFTFPSNGYKGDYIQDIAAIVHRTYGDSFQHNSANIFQSVPADEVDGGDKEAHIDGLIQQAKTLLGATDYEKVFQTGLQTIIDDIRDDLGLFGVKYEKWFSERTLTDTGRVQEALDTLSAKGFTYKKDGAIWFKATDFDDEKDRVLVRDNGQSTYFASDVAYHLDKSQRGFDKLINIWGADHHGYVPRVNAALTALGVNSDCLTVLLVQFASLYRGNEKLQMSTRSGEFVTLRELRKEVGADAARFFYVLRKSEQHMEFDLELAKSQSNDNPVYYIQYAHARISSVLRQATEQNKAWQVGSVDFQRLDTPHEYNMMQLLSRYPEVIESASLAYEPHQVAYYLKDLAMGFHTYYNAHKFILDDIALCHARLGLILATQQVLRNGLKLLGVSAPDKM